MRAVPSTLVLMVVVGLTFAVASALPGGDVPKGIVLFVVTTAVSWLIATGKLFGAHRERD